MKKDKPSMGILVETILEKRDPRKDKPEKEYEEGMEEEDKEEGLPRQAIAQDLIDALRGGNPDGVIVALEAFWEATPGYAMSHRDDDPECGSK